MMTYGATMTKMGLMTVASFAFVSVAVADPVPQIDQEATDLEMAPAMIPDDAEAGSATGSAAIIAAQQPDQILFSDLSRMSVMAAEGEAVGQVRDLLLTRDGRVEGIILSMGGVLGIGGKEIALPWNDIVAYAGDDGIEILTTTIHAAALEAAPAFRTQLTQTAESFDPLHVPDVEPAAGPPSDEDGMIDGGVLP